MANLETEGQKASSEAGLDKTSKSGGENSLEPHQVGGLEGISGHIFGHMMANETTPKAGGDTNVDPSGKEVDPSGKTPSKTAEQDHPNQVDLPQQDTKN